MVLLYKNDAVLLTQRLQSRPLNIFMSSLAGSVLGLLGMLRFIMNFIEEKYEIYLENRNRRRSLKELSNNRIEIIDKNLFIFEKKHKPPLESCQCTSREILSTTEFNLEFGIHHTYITT